MSIFGLQTFDETGALTLDISDRICSIRGQISTGTSDNSFVIPLPAGGNPFFFLVPSANPDWQSIPSTNIAGATVSWSFYGVPTPVACILVYGWY